MVSLSVVRGHNETLKALGPGLVAVFVGGTSGIGLSTAREFVRNTTAPHVYLVGRNQDKANELIQEFKQLNSSSEINFIKSDVSLLRNVDEVCKEIKQKEVIVNLLFLSSGYLSTAGRDETLEGLDKKFSTHYYSRLRFTTQLLHQLTKASESNQLSRVVSVLDPGVRNKGTVNLDDISLKNTFTVKNCATHACTMNNFAMEKLAKQYPGTTFIHMYPSFVVTGIGRGLGSMMNKTLQITSVLLKPFSVDFKESGERHLYAATSDVYPPAKAKETLNVAVGSDGTKGGGSYWLNWDNEPEKQNQAMEKQRAGGLADKVWAHTEGVYRKICEEGAKY